MIVADTNLVVYFLISGEQTAGAEAAYRTDPDWVVPLSWRSEFLNVLSTHYRTGKLTLALAVEAWERAITIVRVAPAEPEAARVLQLSMDSGRSGYDCMFIATAQMNSAPLVTFDQQLLRSFPRTAIMPQQIQQWFAQYR